LLFQRESSRILNNKNVFNDALFAAYVCYGDFITRQVWNFLQLATKREEDRNNDTQQHTTQHTTTTTTTRDRQSQRERMASGGNLKNFFEQQIEANKPPPKPKKERVWTPNNEGAHSKPGFGKQSKVKTVVRIPNSHIQ